MKRQDIFYRSNARYIDIEKYLYYCIIEEESTQDNTQVYGGVAWEIINRLLQ